ncbi:hypothetical protein PIB30_069592 [Stylosanthes scabra]|uniref:Uncharacterized protein n=1 Tax=Stylosanthes scabra TaxID=79078 RepID=A0ABU6XL14_9FABA|nr:hypothetical protein [Stylosanthes scabra]
MARPEYRYVARGVSAPLFSHSGVAPGGPCRQTIRIAAAHSVSAPEHRRDACSRRSLGPGGVVPGVPPGLVRDVARESSPLIAPRPSSRTTSVSVLSGVVRPVGKSGPCGTGGRAGSACAARSPSCISQRMATCPEYAHEEGVRSGFAAAEGAVPGGARDRGQSRVRFRSPQFMSTRFRSRRIRSLRFRSPRFKSLRCIHQRLGLAMG